MFDNSIEPLAPRKKQKPVEAYADEIAKKHNLHTNDQLTMRGNARIYFADYQQKTEVMRSHENRISSKKDDGQTVSAMMDLAESKGWDRIKLTGTTDFKREAWVQAQARGLETEGYKPKNTDKQELARRTESVKPVVAREKASPRPAQKQGPSGRPESSQQIQPKANEKVATGQRPNERAMWNVVEGNGAKARAAETTPTQKPSQNQAA